MRKAWVCLLVASVLELAAVPMVSASASAQVPDVKGEVPTVATRVPDVWGAGAKVPPSEVWPIPAQLEEVRKPRPERMLLQVQPLRQRPELDNGCEVTALAMMLAYAGKPVSKVELANRLPKDLTPERLDAAGRIVYWGDPNRGFVGDITGRRRGYGVYHGPMAKLAERYLPGRVMDLSGGEFEPVLDSVAEGRPVVVWSQAGHKPIRDFVTWQSPTGPVRATFNEHAVLVVGYDPQTIVLADPLLGKVIRVNRGLFLQTWKSMGRQAIGYR